MSEQQSSHHYHQLLGDIQTRLEALRAQQAAEILSGLFGGAKAAPSFEQPLTRLQREEQETAEKLYATLMQEGKVDKREGLNQLSVEEKHKTTMQVLHGRTEGMVDEFRGMETDAAGKQEGSVEGLADKVEGMGMDG